MAKAKQICERARRLVRENGGFVPLNEAQFIWNHEPDATGKWLEEALVVAPTGLMGTAVHDLSSSTGADSEGWPNAPYNNPGLIFGQLILHDWKSEVERIEAIAEFAKIDELGWAREILRGIAFDVGAFYNDDDQDLWAEMRSIEDIERFRDEIIAELERRAERQEES